MTGSSYVQGKNKPDGSGRQENNKSNRNRQGVRNRDGTQRKRSTGPPMVLGNMRELDLCRFLKASGLGAFLVLWMGDVARPATDDIPHVAFMGFQLINTSLEPTTPTEDQRIHMLDDLFKQKLDASGRFKMVPIPSDLRQEIDAGPEISNCNGCQRGWARKVGADWVAWGTVQKVSNLIPNINVYMEDARTGKPQFVKSVDIRGNSDESWRPGLDYLLRHYLFGEP